jgi:signal recognition particle GTPase
LELLTQVVGITGLILTKLDGSARGGCVVCFNFHLNHNFVWFQTLVYFLASPFFSLFFYIFIFKGDVGNRCNCDFILQVSVVDELGIPVKFVGVGEGVEDLQPFDAEAFVNAIFS